MAFWHKSEDEYQKMQHIIEQSPGINGNKLAKELGVAPSTVQRRLPGMDEAGYLLYEDERGGLWPFGRKG